MTLILKNKGTIIIDDFIFKCSIGKGGKTQQKSEGDKKTPMGFFSLGNLYFRKDRLKRPLTKLKSISIKKNMGWCNDVNNKKLYNKLINLNKIKNVSHEKIFRKDNKYDFLIPINYNCKKTIVGKGSAIFLHLTKNYKPTAGCISLTKKDFLIVLKLINRKTKFRIS
tara:strand:- start:534 stop:1034 length:501 start_codon:yes stop_codon:yes gene_type:complete